MARRTAANPAATLMLGYWLPVALYVGVIFLLSAQPNLKPPLTFTMGDKVMHVLEYGGLGFLLVRGIHATSPRMAPLSKALLALSIAIVVATCDELFQSTVPGRQSSGLDLAADALGAGLAQLFYRALGRG